MGKRQNLILVLLLLLTLILPITAYANDWQDWLQGVEINELEGNKSDLTVDGNLKSQPATWGDLIRLLNKDNNGENNGSKNEFTEALEINYKSRTPLVITKVEVSQIFKTIIELESGYLLNRTSENLLNRNIHKIAPERNYLSNGELEDLFNNLDNYEVDRGILKEIKVGKFIEMLPDGRRGIFDIIRGNRINRETLQLNIKTPWEVRNGIYELVLENNVVTSLSSTDEFKYGFVENTREGLKVNDKLVPINSPIPVSSGNYIEYIESDKVIVTRNFKTPKTYIVENVKEGTLNTYEGLQLDDKYNYITTNGIQISLKDIVEDNVLFVFEDETVLVASNSNDENFSYIGETLSINGVMYDSKNILVTDGDFMGKLSNWEYNNKISSGEVVRDLFNTPIMIKIPKVYHTVYIKSIDKDKVDVYSESLQNDVNLDKYRNKLRENELYDIEIINNEVVKIDKAENIKDKIDNLMLSSLSIRGMRYIVDSDTLVIINDDKNIEISTYGELLKEYKEKIMDGYMELEAYVSDREIIALKVAYIPVLRNDADNKLPKSDYYKIDKIEYKHGVTMVTLSVGEESATYIYNRYLSKRYEGTEVQVKFTRDGIIESIK